VGRVAKERDTPIQGKFSDEEPTVLHCPAATYSEIENKQEKGEKSR
jgi:hypothetical protein